MHFLAEIIYLPTGNRLHLMSRLVSTGHNQSRINQRFEKNRNSPQCTHRQQRLAIWREIRKRRELGGDTRLQALAEWAQPELRLKFQPSRPVISRITSLNCVHAAIAANDTMRNRGPTQPAIESKIIQWVKNQKILRNYLTGDVIRLKGESRDEESEQFVPGRGQSTVQIYI